MTERRFYWIKKAIDQKVATKIMKLEMTFEKEMLSTKCKDYEILFEEHIKKIEQIISKGAKEINEWREKLKEAKRLDEVIIQQN